MVNKVAVIAIVAILAVPILIGFGMNLEPTTKTEYLADENQVNVTPLLQNDVGYSNVAANTYELNSDFVIRTDNADNSPIDPVYNKISNTITSLPGNYRSRTSIPSGTYPTANYDLYTSLFKYDPSAGRIDLDVVYLDNDNNTQTITLQRVYWNYVDYSTSDHDLYYVLYGNTLADPMTSGVIQKCVSTHIVKVGSFTVQYHQWYNIPGTTTEHFDISGGYYFVGATPVDIWAINLPEKTSSAIMTINLDSITANSYSLDIGLHNTVYDFRIIKSTTGGVVSWEIKKGSTVIPLYYDPSRSDNSYQIKIDFEHTRNYMVGIYEKKEYKTHYEFRYVGSWPTLIGEANYYQKYTLDVTNTRDIYDPDDYMDRINLAYPNHTAPYYNSITVRMDAALFAGTEYPVISNNEYDPAAFRTNPSTTIKNITQYGNSIIFAGETYTVGSDGNITVGTHKVSLDGIVLDSVPVAGGYENRINGYVISTTADPSTIQFKGAWVASVATDSQSINTYQTTVWHAGEFAWDGMDQNFLIVGLITSLGVFIGLGIYARKSNSKGVIPLMIVCGGAAVLFFIML